MENLRKHGFLKKNIENLENTCVFSGSPGFSMIFFKKTCVFSGFPGFSRSADSWARAEPSQGAAMAQESADLKKPGKPEKTQVFLKKITKKPGKPEKTQVFSRFSAFFFKKPVFS